MSVTPNRTWPAGPAAGFQGGRRDAQASSHGGQEAPDDDDWRVMLGSAKRRRIRNRVAQRTYRRAKRERLDRLEKSLDEHELLEDDPPGLTRSGHSSLNPSPSMNMLGVGFMRPDETSASCATPASSNSQVSLGMFDYAFTDSALMESFRYQGLSTNETGLPNFDLADHETMSSSFSFMDDNLHEFQESLSLGVKHGCPEQGFECPRPLDQLLSDVPSAERPILDNDKNPNAILDLPVPNGGIAVTDDVAKTTFDASSQCPQSAGQDESSPSSTPSASDQSTSFEDTTDDDEYWADCDANNLQERSRLLQRAPFILRLALQRFAEWKCGEHRETPGGEDGTSRGASVPSSTTMASASNNEEGARKSSTGRKRQTRHGADSGPNDDDDNDDDQDRPSSNKKARLDTADDQAPLFACPFYKRDIAKHHKCLSFTLRRIKDVKQHVVRRHMQPLFCITCGQTFDSQESQESHLFERSCNRSDTFDRPEGITNDQRAKLTTRVSKTLSPDKQWYSVWKIIWPGVAPPASPYISSAFVEAIEEVRRFWAENGREIIAEQLGTADTPYGLPAEERLLTSLFLNCGQRMIEMFTNRLVSRDDPAGPGRQDNSEVANYASSTGAIGSQTSMPQLTLDGSDLTQEPQRLTQPERAWQVDEPPVVPDIAGWSAVTGNYHLDDQPEPEAGNQRFETWPTDITGTYQASYTAGMGGVASFVDMGDIENSLEYSSAMITFDEMTTRAMDTYGSQPKASISDLMTSYGQSSSTMHYS